MTVCSMIKVYLTNTNSGRCDLIGMDIMSSHSIDSFYNFWNNDQGVPGKWSRGLCFESLFGGLAYNLPFGNVNVQCWLRREYKKRSAFWPFRIAAG